MGKTTLFKSSKYKSFISARDKALEEVHLNAQTDISRLLFESLDQVESIVARMVVSSEISIYQMNSLSLQLNTHLSEIFTPLYFKILDRIKKMRTALSVLVYTSELEALSRATNKIATNQNATEFEKKIKALQNATTIQGEQLDKRVWIGLARVKAKIQDAFNLALVQELSPPEVLEKVKKAFPKIESYKKPPRELKPIKEADQSQTKKNEIYQFGFIDDADWQLALDAYVSTELPASRFDNVAEYDPEAGYNRYNWEIEQQLTDDFVQQVRSGQVQAAEDLGIIEFVWVAIIDNRTDECCVNRNGHTTSEIETMLANGDLDKNKCDATVPPAHPNCRCQLAPVASIDEVAGPDWKSFEEWLNT